MLPGKIKSCYIFIVLLFSVTISEELILQNTPDGYNGCQDTYLPSGLYIVSIASPDIQYITKFTVSQ